jgi:hypothetical protein
LTWVNFHISKLQTTKAAVTGNLAMRSNKRRIRLPELSITFEEKFNHSNSGTAAFDPVSKEICGRVAEALITSTCLSAKPED